MAKKTDTTNAPATPAAQPRKQTPKVTNVVKRMTPEQREEWFQKNCSKLDADTQKVIREKMAQPMTVRKAAGSKGMDYNQDWVASLSLMQVLSIKTLIDANISTRDEEKVKAREELKAKMEALKAQEAALA